MNWKRILRPVAERIRTDGWDDMGTYIDSDGRPMYPGAWYYLGEELARSTVAQFFVERDSSQRRVMLYQSDSDATFAPQLQIEVSEIKAEFIRYLGMHPHLLYELHPHKFEAVIAALFKGRGYEVIPTPLTRDGGRDLIAIYKEPFGTIVTLVECKRYSSKRRIGPALVRQLYGVVESHRANHGILATTTFFTEGARQLELELRYRLSLRDYTDLVAWCQAFEPVLQNRR